MEITSTLVSRAETVVRGKRSNLFTGNDFVTCLRRRVMNEAATLFELSTSFGIVRIKDFEKFFRTERGRAISLFRLRTGRWGV
jgi:hypothetical protein